jgi:hypothetical protein
MTGKTKQMTLIFLGMAMIITVVIAASLPRLELHPGMPLPSLDNGRMVFAPIEEAPLVSISVNDFYKSLIFPILAGLILYIFYRMFRSIGWKKLGSFIQPLIAICMIIFSVVLIVFLLPKNRSAPVIEMPLPIDTPPPVTSPLGPVPPILPLFVGIGMLLISILLGIWIFLSRRRPTAVDLVVLEAEKARQELIEGKDLKDVILKCYLQMSLALKKEQGIERENFMTTREFENILAAAGFPYDPIHQLTQLFEAVRYGEWRPNRVDEKKAINCLEAIMEFSAELKKKD